MEMWKCLALIAVFFSVVYCVQGSSPSDDNEYLSVESWQTEPSEERLTGKVAEIMKRSRSHQFYGLMGRRSGVQLPARQGRKRNKGEMFVGLMGRRSSSGEGDLPVEKELFQWKRSSNGGELQEEWNKS